MSGYIISTKKTYRFLFLVVLSVCFSCAQADTSNIKENNKSPKKLNGELKEALGPKELIAKLNKGQDNQSRLSCKPVIKQSSALALDDTVTPVWVKDGGVDPEIFSDAPIHAYKIKDKTCITITRYINARVCGSALTSLDGPTVVTNRSPENLSFDQFDYHNWIMSPYVLGDGSIVGLGHSEWYDCLTSPSKKCNGQDKINSRANAITAYKSYDEGASWQRKSIVKRPKEYPEFLKTMWKNHHQVGFGFFTPSNIIREDKNYYALVRYTGRDPKNSNIKNQGLVLITTTDPASNQWHQFSGKKDDANDDRSVDVIPGTDKWGAVTVTWNELMCQYLILYWDFPNHRLMSTTTKSLANIEFSPPFEVLNQKNIQIPGNDRKGLDGHNYPTTQLDPDSKSVNFETTDDSFFIFLNSFTKKDIKKRNIYRITAHLVDASHK